jgi:hypothetical protein
MGHELLIEDGGAAMMYVGEAQGGCDARIGEGPKWWR